MLLEKYFTLKFKKKKKQDCMKEKKTMHRTLASMPGCCAAPRILVASWRPQWCVCLGNTAGES